MKWEYLVEGVPAYQGSNIGIIKPMGPQDAIAIHLNTRGAEGWELVHVDRSVGLDARDPYFLGVVLYFKRLG